MKLAIGVATFAIAALAQDYDESERAKKDKKCRGLVEPTDCAGCEAARKCLKGFPDFLAICQDDFGMDSDGFCPCITAEPTTCAECQTMGVRCVKTQAFADICTGFDWNVRKNECITPCDSTEPTNCGECQALGLRCVKEGGFADICADFGWKAKANECLAVCGTTEPTTCDECKTLTPRCVKEEGFEDICKGFGYQLKQDFCVEPCDTTPPATCEDCLTLGTRCVKELVLGETCRDFGLNKKGVCEVACADTEPGTCDDCVALGQKCVREKGHSDVCVDFGWLGAGKKGVNECTTPCPTTISTCDECTDIEKRCFKANKDLLETCKLAGFNGEECLTPCDELPEEPVCDDCVTLGAECVTRNKKVDKLCARLNYISRTNTCKADCGGVVINRDSACAACILAKDTGDHCIKPFTKICQKALGWDSRKNTCPADCVATEPTSCAECVDLTPRCVEEGDFVELCKEDFGWIQGKKDDSKCPPTCGDTPTTCEECKVLSDECRKFLKRTCKPLLKERC